MESPAGHSVVLDVFVSASPAGTISQYPKNSGYRRYITDRLLLDLNSKDRDMLEVNNNNI